MPASAASVADDDRRAVAADVPRLIAHAADYIAEGPALDLRGQAGLGALTGDMAGDVAEVAHRLVSALPGEMAGLSAVVAGLLVGAVGGDVAGAVAVVAEPGFTGGWGGIGAVSSEMAGFVAVVADGIVAAFAGNVSGLLAVPADSFCCAFGRDVSRK